MRVIEDLLDQETADKIEKTLTSDNFAWHFFNRTCDSDQYKDHYTLDCSQFCHGFYKNGMVNSNHFGLVSPIISKLGHSINELVRIKANLMFCQPSYPERFYTLPHTDASNVDTESILYYVNDSDGDTVIFNEKPPINNGVSQRKRIHPKKNRALLFDSSYLHASSPPKMHELRIVLNFVFLK